jgi:oleate hydratase
MNRRRQPEAYLVGGGIESLAAAAFMIRGQRAAWREYVTGGSLNGGGEPATGYSTRGGRGLTTDNYA